MDIEKIAEMIHYRFNDEAAKLGIYIHPKFQVAWEKIPLRERQLSINTLQAVLPMAKKLKLL